MILTLLPNYDPDISRQWKWDQTLVDDADPLQLSTRPTCLLSTKDNDLERNVDLRWAKIGDLEHLNVFNNDLLNYLRGLSEFVYNHQDVSRHIRCFVEQEVQKYPDSFQTVDAEKLKEDLSYLAFTKEFAERAVESIEESVLYEHNALYWTVFVLEKWILCDNASIELALDLFDYDVLCDQGDYKYNSDVTDEPFIHVFDMNNANRANSGPKERRIQIVNMKDLVNWPGYDSIPQDDSGDRYYYHGTSWASADEIVKGIKLQSRNPQDFTFRGCPGFYVSNSFVAATDWAKRNECPAVIVFKVNRNVFNNRDDRNHIDLTSSPEDRIISFVKYFRTKGKCDDLRFNVAFTTRNCLSITGPVLRYPCIFDTCSNDDPVVYWHDNQMQTCIRDQAMADQFNASIHLIVNYKRNPIRQTTRRR